MEQVDRRHIRPKLFLCPANTQSILSNAVVAAVSGNGRGFVCPLFLWLIKAYLLNGNVIRQTVFHGRIFRYGFCGCHHIRFGLFFCLLQKPADIADFLHTVNREACIVLECDVTHRNIAADFAYAFNAIAAVITRDFFADKVGIIRFTLGVFPCKPLWDMLGTI